MSVLQGIIGRICLAYLDDVIVFSKRRLEHVNDWRAVLARIRDAGLKLKHTRCKLYFEQVLYLGHVILAAGVSPNPIKIAWFRKLAASNHCPRIAVLPRLCKLLLRFN